VHLRALMWGERIRLDGLGMVEDLDNEKGDRTGAVPCFEFFAMRVVLDP